VSSEYSYIIFIRGLEDNNSKHSDKVSVCWDSLYITNKTSVGGNGVNLHFKNI
jgi:hypothetical protein